MKNRALEQSKVIAIVAGGQMERSVLPKLPHTHFVIGVDRGALWLVNHKISPDLSIGDFDSVTLAQKKQIHDHSGIFIAYAPEKDATDLELAVDYAMEIGATEVYFFGVLGKRFDHSLGAIQMLLRLESHNIYGVIVDNYSKINIVRHQETFAHDTAYRYVSVIPVSLKAVVSLKGFAYELSHTTLHGGSTRGLSNEILKKSARITVHQGSVLVIRSSDVFIG